MLLFQVDAFTDRPFSGNPAAVCLLREKKDDIWLQDVAREMNLSETAFLQRREDVFDLRWFTPAVEVDLCGHATLASAHFLWEQDEVAGEQAIVFRTRSGELRAERNGDWIELDFPATPDEPSTSDIDLPQALGTEPVYVGKSRFDLIVEVDSEDTLKAIRPNYSLLEKAAARGTIVTSRPASGEYDFVSRFFAPQSGVNEDPVTGSAHCCLAPFWGSRLDKTEMTGYQASQRGGVVRVRWAGDRVILGGKAVTVMRLELL